MFLVKLLCLAPSVTNISHLAKISHKNIGQKKTACQRDPPPLYQQFQGVCGTKVSYTGLKNSNNHFQTAPFWLYLDIHKRQFLSCNMIFWPKILFTFLPAVPPEKITSYICLERIFPCWKFRGDIPNKVIQSNNSQNCHKSGLNIVEWN